LERLFRKLSQSNYSSNFLISEGGRRFENERTAELRELMALTKERETEVFAVRWKRSR
jgi:hypothetical protein